MMISVLIPTYRRRVDLERCLRAVQDQSYSAFEVIVIVRDTDTETQKFLNEIILENLPLELVTVSKGGQVAALNKGLSFASGDIISITDDDAVPHRDWLKMISHHFSSNHDVGGVGGRDYLYIDGEIIDDNQFQDKKSIGKITWFGRVNGNHHLGSIHIQEVDILKGVNMSFRRAAIQDSIFDTRLLGNGAQVCNDMAFSLSIKRKGWKLIYDPKVSVKHFQGERLDSDQRYKFDYDSSLFHSFNEAIAIIENTALQKKIFYLFWSFLIGSRDCFGLVQFIRFFLMRDTFAGKRLHASIAGKVKAIKLLTELFFLKSDSTQ
jgi:glycosyltransferase involved in cell wall biosynthesis